MNRKYKQRGYMERQKEERPRNRQRSSGPRGRDMPGVRNVFRCGICGSARPVEFGISSESQCSQCGADLHTCKNCLHFDTSSRFECTQPIPQRITPKDKRNPCDLFKVRITVERETSTSPSKVKDPRQAFDRLFKI